MSSTKYQKGPWKITYPKPHDDGTVGIDADGHLSLARVVWLMNYDKAEGRNSPKCEANARLIEKTPETFEVLKDLLAGVKAAIAAGDWKVDGACDPDATIAQAEAIIAAVEQET